MMIGFPIERFKMLKKIIKQDDIDKKLGKQHSYESHSKLFKPIIDTAKETSKDLQQKIVDDRTNLNNVLVPFTNQLIQANNDRAAIQAMPFYNSDIQEERFSPRPVASSTPTKDTPDMFIDLDKLLSDTDKENLKDMSLPLPSEVIEQRNYDSVLEQIKSLNRQCGQYTGKASKKDEKEKEMYKSRRETLEMYKMSLDEQQKALKYKAGEGLKSKKKKLVKPKRGRGRPKTDHIVVYSSPYDLRQQLIKFMSAYNAGHTNVEKIIVHILDELLRIKEITKQEYDILYNDIYNNLKI